MAIDWKGVRRGYESGARAAELAERYGCRPETVRRRARKEGWERRGTKGGGDCVSGCPASKDLWCVVKKDLIEGMGDSDARAGLDRIKRAKMAGEVISRIQTEGNDSGSDGELREDAAGVAEEMDRATVPRGTEEAVDRR